MSTGSAVLITTIIIITTNRKLPLYIYSLYIVNRTSI